METVYGSGTPILSTLYGPVALSTMFTTYVATLASSSTSSAIPGPTQTTATTKLSAGARAGIGIVITFVLLAAIVIEWFVLQKGRRASPHPSEVMAISGAGFEKPEFDAIEASKEEGAYISHVQ